jgi:Caspase domain
MKSIIPYLLLGLSTIATAQSNPPTPSWVNNKLANDGRLNAIIENQNGELVAVGTSYVAGQRRDALWLLLKKDGIVLKETTINGNDNRNDEAFAVRQTLDGNYALVGTTQTRETGKTDAWLVKTDDKGVAILSKQFGSIGDDAFFDITEDKDGNLYAVGHENGGLYVVKTDKKGALLFQKTYEGTAIQNAALTWLSEGKLAIVGCEIINKKPQSFLKCLDTEGSLLWQRTLDDVLINAVKRERSGGLVLAGVGTKSKKAAEDMVVVRVDATGQGIETRSYFGGDGRDIAQALALDTEGGAYLLGNTTSTQSGGARAEDFCLLKIKDKEKAWKQPVSWGGANVERGLGITITHSGSVITVGEQANDAFAIGFNDIAPPKTSGVTSLRIEQPTLLDDGNDNGTLEENEHGAIAFTVKNEGQNDAIDIVADMETTTSGILFPKKINIGELQAGETRRVGIPLSISRNIRAENGQMTIRLSARNTNSVVTTQVFIPIQVSDKVDLVVASFQFSNTPIRRNQALNLKVTIRNQGQKIAQGVRLSCILPNDITCLTQPTNIPRFDLGDMPSNASKEVSMDIKVPSFYADNNLMIKLSLREIGGAIVQQREVTASLVPFETDEVVRQKFASKDSVVVQWLSPFEDDLVNKHLDYTRRLLPLKVKGLSNQPLTEKSFRVWLNGKIYETGSKSDNIKLKANGASNGYRYAFTYVQTVELTEGESRLFVEVQNASGTGKSEEIMVNKRTVKPTLHVLSIGVPHADLQFTTNDAADFAKVCSAQQGKFFDKVNVVVKNTAAETTIEALRRSIRSLQLDFVETGAIKPEDLIIFFISSHGKSDKTTSFFKIAASDLQETFIGTTCLDFKEDILGVLSPLNCKKLILLDACQSGAAASDDRLVTGSKSMEADISNAIQRFVDAESDLVCISSSSERENSYEDPKWQNGAFTEALIEALTNAPTLINGKIEKADKDNNGFVELKELYDFISLRIPQMVQETKQKKQTPKMKEAVSFPLFYIR